MGSVPSLSFVGKCYPADAAFMVMVSSQSDAPTDTRCRLGWQCFSAVCPTTAAGPQILVGVRSIYIYSTTGKIVIFQILFFSRLLAFKWFLMDIPLATFNGAIGRAMRRVLKGFNF
jgi:hypothetical protein